MSLSQTVRDIKSLKIQGAENVAAASLKALKDVILRSKKIDPPAFERELKLAKDSLQATRPTEPYMRNMLKSILYEAYSDKIRVFHENVLRNIQFALIKMKKDREFIADIGAAKIPKGSVVFTHCKSSTVLEILEKAHKTKNFIVHNTETRPWFQGRMMAAALASHGIKVQHFVDSAMRLAIKKADLVLLGADAITAEGKIINKIGSELVAEVAEKRGIPLYVCTNSLKFDPKTIFGFEEQIEERASSEVWSNPPKNVEVNNLIFEIIDPALVSGVITELGIYKPYVLVEEVKRSYPWIL